MDSAPRPATSTIRLAERDLIHDRFPFFAIAWLATSFVWLYTLASGDRPLLSWRAALATAAAELAILIPAARHIGRIPGALATRAGVLAALGALPMVWTVAASGTAAPLAVLMPVLAAFMITPPLFFAWSWQVELGLMLAVTLPAAVWMMVVEPASGVALRDLLVVFGSMTALGTALAARVSRELALRLARREQEEESRRALTESREAQLESEERFRVAFHRAPFGMSMVGADGIVHQVNDAFARLVGRDREELVGTSVDDLIDPEDLALAHAHRRKVLSGDFESVETVMRLRHRDGHAILARVIRSMVRDRHGKPSLMIGQVEDVTERRRAEEALRTSLDELRRSEEQLRLLAQRQVRVREEERRRLGFDLHDDVCQELVGTGIMVESVRGRLHATDPEASQKLARVGRHLNDLGEHLRLVARELRPMLLHDLGLEDSVRSLAAGMSTTTRITTHVPTPIARLGEEIEVAVYRIVQEAISNALRHAHADEIVVTLAASEGVLRAEIRDDGRGFDANARHREALGLVSMEERALAVGGKLQVISSPGRGTTVVLTCPLLRSVPRPAA